MVRHRKPLVWQGLLGAAPRSGVRINGVMLGNVHRGTWHVVST